MSTPTSSNLTFFASAAASFQPTPYSSSSTRTPSFQSTRSQSRSHEALAVPPAGMDPHETDPGVFFIRPPFTEFPDCHLHPDGLSYGLMAENPEWFLRAEDFVSQLNNNASAIAYPPHLEPPRGWCPAKKKDLKERGAEGWPEGEEPRLRCTFCRRTYAGVNAKSMWRRHVFEKHKIAMSNRRDGNVDRPRGRGSGKENRQASSSKSQPDAHDRLVSIVVAPQTAPQNSSHKSRFRSKQVSVPVKEVLQDVAAAVEAPPSPQLYPSQPSSVSEDNDEDYRPEHIRTPPLTPHLDTSSDPPGLALDAHPEEEETHQPQITVPLSPYNPLQTPSFRHSPPKLPSDQPWRFPSPSHPLHSRTRELPLAMIAGPSGSPLLKAGTLVGASPMPMHSSPLSFLSSNHTRLGELETPARPRFALSKLTHKSYLIRTQYPSPLSKTNDTDAITPFSVTSSPFSSAVSKHRRYPSDVSDAWLNEVSPPSDPLHSNNDPFSIYDAWPSMTGATIISPVRLPRSLVEGESPVLRNGSSSTSIGFGIGLLEPFSLPKDLESGDADINELLTSPIKRSNKRLLDAKRPGMSIAETSPPSKRRKMGDSDSFL